jgi:predicted TIM-barrel fold metal-dependent hydrolase
MFGTDYPLECKTAANIIESMNVVREAARSPEDRAAMLGQTAAALFKIA